MRIAITGGTGFVGRHLATCLAAEGHEVVVIARGVDRRDDSTLTLPNVRWVRILSEGVVEPVGVSASLPEDLLPTIPFQEPSIRAGLPAPGGFGSDDLRPCLALRAALSRG